MQTRLTTSESKYVEATIKEIEKKFNVKLLVITEPETDEQFQILGQILFERYKKRRSERSAFISA